MSIIFVDGDMISFWEYAANRLHNAYRQKEMKCTNVGLILQ